MQRFPDHDLIDRAFRIAPDRPVFDQPSRLQPMRQFRPARFERQNLPHQPGLVARRHEQPEACVRQRDGVEDEEIDDGFLGILALAAQQRATWNPRTPAVHQISPRRGIDREAQIIPRRSLAAEIEAAFLLDRVLLDRLHLSLEMRQFARCRAVALEEEGRGPENHQRHAGRHCIACRL